MFLLVNKPKNEILIKESVGSFHKSGLMHQIVGQDVGKVFHLILTKPKLIIFI